MRPLIVLILLTLGICVAYTSRATAPAASGAKPAEAHARRAACRKLATTKKLSGTERQAFIDHCVTNRPK